MPDTRLSVWRGTVRLRITSVATIAVALGLVAAAVTIVVIVQRDQVRTLDVELERDVAEIAAMLDDPPALLQNLEQRRGDEFFAQVTSEGEIVAASPIATGIGLIDASGLRSNPGTLAEVPVDDGAFRVVVLETPERTVVIGRALEDVRENVAAVSGALAAVVPILTFGLAGLVWVLVGRTLKPVEDIRTEVANLNGSNDLDTRVSVPRTNDEIARLAVTMNDMLERVENATKQQRAFIADASHELRIPITRLRTQLEVETVPDTIGLLEDVVDIQALAEDLLYLARLDSGATRVRNELIDLDEVLRTQGWEEPRSQVEITVTAEPVMVAGRTIELERAVRNLVDNAARHAASLVTVSLIRSGSEAVVTVRDDGAGIPVDMHEEVFERFARIDEARSSTDGGTGLGLAIVRGIAESHDGTVTIEPTEHGTSVVIRLPAVG